MSALRQKQFLRVNWKKWGIPTALAAVAATLFSWHLGSLIPGLSSADSATLSGSNSLDSIIHNPVNAPYKLLLLAAHVIAPHSLVMARLPALMVAFLFIVSLYYVIQRWFGQTIGLLSTLLAASTPAVLISGRTIAPAVMSLSAILVGATLLLLQRSKTHKTVYLLLLVLSVVWCLYTPGFIWPILAVAVWGRKGLWRSLETVPGRAKSGAILLLVVLLAPLARACFDSHAVARSVVGTGSHLPNVTLALKNIAWTVLSVAWRTPTTGPASLGRLPLLNIIEVALIVFGIYAMVRLARAKTYLLFAYTAGVLLLSAFSPSAIMLLPAMFIFMAAGLRYLYFEWYGVFPSNPIPQYAAFAVILAVCLVSTLYGLRYSLEAWPHNNGTISWYNYSLK